MSSVKRFMLAGLFIVPVLFIQSASANLSLSNTETFTSGFGDWVRIEDTEWINAEGGYARIGKNKGTHPYLENSISNSFNIDSAGTYEIGFDYRFIGFDYSILDDTISVTISLIDETFAPLSSRTDLTYITKSFNDIRGNWVQESYSVILAPGAYNLTFELIEADTGSASTEWDIDNVYVAPEPTTICLLSFGALGLMRKRKA